MGNGVHTSAQDAQVGVAGGEACTHLALRPDDVGKLLKPDVLLRVQLLGREHAE